LQRIGAVATASWIACWDLKPTEVEGSHLRAARPGLDRRPDLFPGRRPTPGDRIMGEYLAKRYLEAKRRPKYFVEKLL
jgi:hypothetical protein